MTSKARRSKYKGVKWINTRFSNAYMARCRWTRFRLEALRGSIAGQMIFIRNKPASNAEQKISKAQAIANLAIEFNQGCINICCE